MHDTTITKAARAKRALSWPYTAVVATAFVFSGCGDEVTSAPPQPAASKGRSKKKPRRGRTGPAAGDQLQFYSKVEAYVSAEEAAGIRHVFRPADFEPDPTGDINRDPFRSYVIRQPGVSSSQDRESSAEPTKVCSSTSLVATNYSLRDLRLAGIVLRGTRSYALFRDTGSLGHIVKKGDCLGQEKARVSAIRAGFVALQLPNESAPNQAPQERTIQLYPEEYNVETER